jgi:hypothetical protein
MKGPRRASTVLLGFGVALALTASGRARGAGPGEPRDSLTAEVERWAAYLRTNKATDETWVQIRKETEPALSRAEAALRDGRLWLALQRLAAVQGNLAAAAYVQDRRVQGGADVSAFEAEWKRLGTVLRSDLGPPAASALDGVQPAAVRAVGEAALAQVRVYYEASLEYGRNTTPEYGLYYLGAAQAGSTFASFCRTLSSPQGRAAPPVRSLAPDLDALEGEVLAAYRPPASIDRHPEFIAASAALKEARELDAVGLRYGALLRYLQATLRLAPLRPRAPAAGRDESARQLGALAARLTEGPADHSLGRIFLEAAEADLAATAPDATPAIAAAIVEDVLPRYFRALESGSPRPEKPAPELTVTLVRWPFT